MVLSMYCDMNGHERCPGRAVRQGLTGPCTCPCHVPGDPVPGSDVVLGEPVVGKIPGDVIVACPAPECGAHCTGGTGYSAHVRHRHAGLDLPPPRCVGSAGNREERAAARAEKAAHQDRQNGSMGAELGTLPDDLEALADEAIQFGGHLKRIARKARAAQANTR